MINYILVNGYFATGASALVDFLKEFESTYTPDMEFRLVKEHRGIIDLDKKLNEANDTLYEDLAIRDFRRFIHEFCKNGSMFRSYGLSYCKHFGSKIEELSNKYIDSLIDYECPCYWWYIDSYDPYYRYIINRIRRKIGLDDRKKKTMSFRFKDEEDFLNKTRGYLNSIFVELLKERIIEADNVVLEQVVPANMSGYAYRYFPNCKVVVFERDPRGVFMDCVKPESANYGQLAPYAVKTHEIHRFVEYYRKMRCVSTMDGEHLLVKFEDFVLNKNNTRERVLDYVGMKGYKHINEGKFFFPEVSRKNVDSWKSSMYPEAIKIIEQELPEYLYE